MKIDTNHRVDIPCVSVNWNRGFVLPFQSYVYIQSRIQDFPWEGRLVKVRRHPTRPLLRKKLYQTKKGNLREGWIRQLI